MKVIKTTTLSTIGCLISAFILYGFLGPALISSTSNTKVGLGLVLMCLVSFWVYMVFDRLFGALIDGSAAAR